MRSSGVANRGSGPEEAAFSSIQHLSELLLQKRTLGCWYQSKMMAGEQQQPTVDELIEQLSQAALDSTSQDGPSYLEACQSLSDELLALQAIYALDDASHLQLSALRSSTGLSSSVVDHWTSGATIVLELRLPLDLPLIGQGSGTTQPPPEALRLSIDIPSQYPYSKSPPILCLLDRFLGPFEIDEKLQSQIERQTFSTLDDDGGSAASNAREAIAWQQGEVVLFESCESVKDTVATWYQHQVEEQDKRRQQDGRAAAGTTTKQVEIQTTEQEEVKRTVGSSSTLPSTTAYLAGRQWVSTPALTDRKSTFVGHAIALHHPDEVAPLLDQLLSSNSKLAKASHPLMRAWVCSIPSTTTNGPNPSSLVVHRDNDDDGESAAGNRLAHLLETLKLNNVLVVVTRWFGGIHLGADRFKLINRVGREAIELAGLMKDSSAGGGGGVGEKSR